MPESKRQLALTTILEEARCLFGRLLSTSRPVQPTLLTTPTITINKRKSWRKQMAWMDDRNDLTQFEKFYRQECPALYRYVYAWMGDPDNALKIMQESFLKLCQMQSSQESPAYKRATLFWIARDKIVYMRRRRARVGDASEDAASNLMALHPAFEVKPGDTLLPKERQEGTTTAFEKLASCDQEYLALRLSGLNYRAVAEIMNIDPILVSRAINQALLKFEAAYDALMRGEGSDEGTGRVKTNNSDDKYDSSKL